MAQFGEYPNLLTSCYLSKKPVQCAELVNFGCNNGINYDASSPDNEKHSRSNLKGKYWHLNVYHGSNAYMSDLICGPQEFWWPLEMHSYLM